MIVILLVAFLLRLVNLDQSLWLDEAISITTVQKYSFLEILTKFIQNDVHPPLYYLTLDLWESLFGFSEISMRLPSVLFALATIYICYLIGKKLSTPRVGLLAAAFLAVNPLFIYYSQEVRMYTMTAFFVALAVYGFTSKKNWLFVLGFMAALYTDYLPILFLPVFIFSNFFSFILIILLFLPWIPTFINQLSVGANFAKEVPAWGSVVGGGTIKSLLLVPVKFIFGRISFDNKIIYALITIAAGLEYFFIVIKSKSKFLWLWLVVPIILGFIVSLKIPIFAYHRFLFVLPAFCLLLATGIRSSRPRIIFILLVSLASVSYFNLSPQFHRENWRDAINYIQSEPGLILMPSRAQSSPVEYYGPNLEVQDKESLSLRGSTIYLIRYVQPLFDPQDSLRQTLESAGYSKTEEKGFNGVLIWKYKAVL